MIPSDTRWDSNVLQVVNNLFPPELGITIEMTPYHLGQAGAGCEWELPRDNDLLHG